MFLVLLGPPGSGKGTQASLLMAKYKAAHISTGDMFREAIKEQTMMGIRAKTYIDKGELVPSEVTIGMVKERLNKKDCQEGFIFDGFPRTVLQAEALESTLKQLGRPLDAVIDINVEKDLLLERLSGRRICRECSRIYHIANLHGKLICPIDNGELYQRDDDKKAAISKRLEIFEEKTSALRDFYSKRNLLIRISGLGDPEEVFFRLEKKLNS